METKGKKVNFGLTEIGKPEIDLISGMVGSRDSKQAASLFLCLSALLLGSPLPPRRQLPSSTRTLSSEVTDPRQRECSLPKKGSRHPRPDSRAVAWLWPWEQTSAQVTLALTVWVISPALVLQLGQLHPRHVDGVGQGGSPQKRGGALFPDEGEGVRGRQTWQTSTTGRLPLNQGLRDIASLLKGRECGPFSQTAPNTAKSPPLS